MAEMTNPKYMAKLVFRQILPWQCAWIVFVVVLAAPIYEFGVVTALKFFVAGGVLALMMSMFFLAAHFLIFAEGEFDE